MLCVFITSLLYRIPIGDQIDGLPLAAGAVFLIFLFERRHSRSFLHIQPHQTVGVFVLFQLRLITLCYANAIHLICDPLAQHLEEPLARSLKELAVI